MIRAIVVVAALTLAAPAASQTAVPNGSAAAIAPARLALGLELAEVLNSEALTRVQLAKLVSETMPKAFAQNPDMAMLDRAYPGAIAAVVKAFEPELVTYTIAALPKLWREVAPIYASNFDESEMRTLLAFYRGPTGRRAIAAMGRGSDYGSTISRMVNEQSSDVTASDLRNGASAGVAELVRTASDEDKAAMVALTRTSAGRKLPTVTPLVMARVAALASAPDPAFQTRIEALTKRVLDDHIRKSGKK